MAIFIGKKVKKKTMDGFRGSEFSDSHEVLGEIK
jgi:hypothetical protein